MARSYTFIKRKVEDAFEALVNALQNSDISSIQKYKGFSGSELTTPRIQYVATRAVPERFGEHYSGNFTVTLVVTVVSHVSDATRDTHAKRCGAIEDIIMRDDIEFYMNNRISVRDFQCYDPGWYPGESEDLTNDSEMMTMYTCECYCWPSVEIADEA